MSKKRSRTAEQRDPKTIAFWSFMAVSLVVIVGGYFIATNRAAPVSSAQPSTEAPSFAVDYPVARDVIAAARTTPDKPLTLAVIGDSTGNEENEWVYAFARTLSPALDRPITIHNWSIDTNRYVSETLVGSGRNAPIVIWNGSAPGKDTTYSTDNFSALYPEPTDLTIISHGLNHTNPDLASTGVQNLIYMARNAQPAPPAIAVVLQNPRLDDKAAQEDATVARLRDTFAPADSGVTAIDVYSAFRAAPDLAALIRPAPDLVHPNATGSNLWASVVTQTLGV